MFRSFTYKKYEQTDGQGDSYLHPENFDCEVVY